jgi:DNA polymerase-3 subunit delta
MPDRPVIYLFHGDDEPAIHGEIEKLKARVGGPGVLEMNFTQLDGRSLAFDDLVTACAAMPFLAERRLVVLDHPLAYAKDEVNREKFLDLLNRIPSSTALVLIEHQALSSLITKDWKKLDKNHWLEDWAEAAGGRVYHKKMVMLETSGGVTGWIQKRATIYGGEFTGRAAARLAELSSTEASILDQEIQKLLTYVDWNRPVEVQDVERLAVEIPETDIFALVDALGNQDGQSAVAMFHHLLEEQDVKSIFPMIIRQFRLLLLCRELLESGASETEVARTLQLHPFVARKVYSQARHFDLPLLETVYHRLLAIDAAWKLGDMDPDLNLNVWMAELTM